MSTDIRNLSKWLNEEQTAPIDRQALARVLAMAEQPAQPTPTKCWKCGDADTAFTDVCQVPACGMREAP